MTTEEKKDIVFDDGRIESIEEFQTPGTLYEELIIRVRKYHPSTDISLIRKAYRIASDAHKGQARKSGEPYIIHPLCVAIILADLELDKETIVAGLLHDVVEDTIMTDEEIKEEFGQDVALLVDGVTKLEKLNFHGEQGNQDKDAEKLERQAENTKRVVDCLAAHPRVDKVNHPSLPDHPDHGLYEKYFPNGGASIFTFEIKGGQAEAHKFIDNLEIFSLLANVADVKSLVIHPATTTHSQPSSEELLDQGIKPNTIRLSIGTEHIDDILADLEKGFAAAARE